MKLSKLIEKYSCSHEILREPLEPSRINGAVESFTAAIGVVQVFFIRPEFLMI